ncbi:hypothetical protein BWZ20_06005 [Winogradskyella sp. J14-2]|uniref:hypothetical protein n=1 Tax=Winogradskyella sp. J14-2 TaxID=1936080 RepID=UPI000972C9C9|nr:hypothetical protein [Winogradskyella sp. J14-2]APY07880.1 hypothetical protein BWZ20_06005 [Winogradskyella sp. J14-2]
MKPFYLSFICLLILSSCKSEKKETPNKTKEAELRIVEKIANAHGYENWVNVEKVAFTFKVDRDTIKGSGRSWVWFPKNDSVYMKAGTQEVRYSRKNLDSVAANVDKAFINDKFWLLVPFQLVWDTSATISEPKKVESPINKEQLEMITITYPDEGGYTPGDAYDIYFDEDYLIREWTYRQGNSPEPSLSNTFENYQDFNGIKIAIDHKKDNGNWNLNFTDVSITLK